MSEHVLIERNGHVMEITLNKPKVNAIDHEMSKAVADAFVLFDKDDISLLAALDSLRIAPLFDGFRGGQAASRTAVLDQIKGLVSLMKAAPDIKEIEINPIMVGKDYACCADALINISSTEA